MTYNDLYLLAGVFVLAVQLQVNGIQEFPCNYNRVKNPVPEVSKNMRKPSRDVNCFDHNNIPYIESIPDPDNCSLFYKCDRIFPDQPMRPYPIRQECPPGLGLCYDFICCYCEYCDIANCFDANNPEHEKDRFKCACPLIEAIDGELTGKDHCDGSQLLSPASRQ